MTLAVDYTTEASHILHALFAPHTTDERWKKAIAGKPEIQAAIHELAYQLASAEQRGRAGKEALVGALS